MPRSWRRGEEPREVKTEIIATNLTAEQVQQKFVAPDTVPFWSLPEIRDRTIRAGLNATGYELQYQKLLAQPLLFMAMILVAAAFSLRFFRFGGIAPHGRGWSGRRLRALRRDEARG